VIALVSAAVRLLTREMTYRVPPQDLSVRMNRVPAIPSSRLIVKEVRAAR
jgi:fatty-acid peroxygenase